MKPYNNNTSYIGPLFPNKNETFAYLPPIEYAKNISLKDELHECPLCTSKKWIPVGKIAIDAVIDGWIQRTGFNPIADVYRHEFIEKRRCSDCGLYFYNYHLPDSEELYQKLEDSINYYIFYRPEYGVATEIIEKLQPESLLEIGCGNGCFLDRVRHIIPRAVGSEYNTAAADMCREKGIEVLTNNISEIKEQFDIVCHFEVLEHVFDTNDFMLSAIRLLKPGGKLIIGTPDPEGIRSVGARSTFGGGSILSLPPHHQFDFSEQSFNWIASKFNLKIFDYKKSELDYFTYRRYVKTLTGIDLQQPDVLGFMETQKKYTGHSHTVVFEKQS